MSINTVSQRSPQRVDTLFSVLGVTNGSSIPLIPNYNTNIRGVINNTFIAGFIDGDGSFSVAFNNNGTQDLRVSIVGSVSIRPLLEYLKTTLSIGSINITKNNTVVRWIIGGGNQIRNVLRFFMDKELLHTEKSVHYSIFREVCFILATRNVTLKDRLRVVDLAYNINKGGKRRKISKKEYLDILYTFPVTSVRLPLWK